MSDALNICLPCGLCCKGTLIGHVQLDNEELPALKKLMDVEDEMGNGFFLQPCDKFCDKCTIYEQRPKQCASFNCGLLNSYNNKELNFDTAIGIINDVIQKESDIKKYIKALNIELKSESFYFKMVELKKVLRNTSPKLLETPIYINLISDLEELDIMMMEEFKVSAY